MKKLFHSIYVRFVLIFIGVLFLSAVLSLGVVTAFQLDEIKGMVQKQLSEKIIALEAMVKDEHIPLQQAVNYAEGAELNILIFKSKKELLENKHFLPLKKHKKKLDEGKTVIKNLNSRPSLPFAAAYLDGQYVVVYPDLENNQISRFQQTAQTVLLTAILMGSLLILLAVSMLVKPIKAISKASVEVANGQFDVQIDYKGHDEIADLVKNFNIMVKELKSNEYLHKDFVSSVSHEFKTPLSSINGFAKILRKQDLSPNEREEYIRIIIEESERLSKLSSNLLRLAQLDHQSIQHRREVFSLDEQIRRVLLLLQEQWERKDIHMEVDLDEVSFRGDEELLQQLWLNLMVNAIKFTPFNGTIKVKLNKIGDMVHFSIEDNGIGITERDQKRIFERFYKVDKSRSKPGTGLGLSIVKKITELHEGRITVKSEPDKGSTFYVELPAMNSIKVSRSLK